MRYRPISPRLFIENRKRFTKTLPPGALVVIHSNDVAQTNADGVRSFIQNSDLFWLTGIDQEETILLLYPDSAVPDRSALLFVKKTDEHTAIWEGNKLSKSEASQISGIDNVLWTSSFDGYFKRLMAETELVYLLSDQHPGRQLQPADRNQRYAQRCRDNFPLHRYHNAAPLLHNLRQIKSSEEINLLQEACNITHEGFIAACKAIAPGRYEYEIEAEFARAFLRRGARGFAYEPIIASGDQSCVLHYTGNDRKMASGEVVLMDVGASYANYAADMTRTVPVNGKFTARQRAVYDAVLRVLREASAMIRPGLRPADYHTGVEELIDKELVDLGLISMTDLRTQDPKHPVRSQYYYHRSTHSLGIDVHDPGDIHAPFAAGMVLTCEPGIYVREEGFGIRLENNLVVTNDGVLDLMENIPIEPGEIESLISA